MELFLLLIMACLFGLKDTANTLFKVFAWFIFVPFAFVQASTVSPWFGIVTGLSLLALAVYDLFLKPIQH